MAVRVTQSSVEVLRPNAAVVVITFVPQIIRRR